MTDLGRNIYGALDALDDDKWSLKWKKGPDEIKAFYKNPGSDKNQIIVYARISGPIWKVKVGTGVEKSYDELKMDTEVDLGYLESRRIAKKLTKYIKNYLKKKENSNTEQIVASLNAECIEVVIPKPQAPRGRVLEIDPVDEVIVPERKTFSFKKKKLEITPNMIIIGLVIFVISLFVLIPFLCLTR